MPKKINFTVNTESSGTRLDAVIVNTIDAIAPADQTIPLAYMKNDTNPVGFTSNGCYGATAPLDNPVIAVNQKLNDGTLRLAFDGRGLVKKPGVSWRSPGFEQGPRHPVVHVSWHDAVAFCQWASQVSGMDIRLPTRRPGYMTGTLRRPCWTKTMAKITSTITMRVKTIRKRAVAGSARSPAMRCICVEWPLGYAGCPGTGIGGDNLGSSTEARTRSNRFLKYMTVEPARWKHATTSSVVIG